MRFKAKNTVGSENNNKTLGREAYGDILTTTKLRYFLAWIVVNLQTLSKELWGKLEDFLKNYFQSSFLKKKNTN